MSGSAPTWNDIYDVGLSVLQGRNPALVVRQGDVTDAYLCGGASMANMIIGASAKNFRAAMVLFATGDDLTVATHDRGVDRDTGDAAVGSVTFTRSGGGVAGTIPAGTQIATEPDPTTGLFSTYTTDTDLPFASFDLSKSVTATCTLVGKAGNALPGAIDRVLTTLFGAFTVTNAVSFAGGNESESDQDLVTRTTKYPLVLRRGTVDALIYGALTTPGVARVSVVANGGPISMYVSDASGNSNPTLAAACQAVINGPPAWRAAGDIVTVIPASLFLQNVVLQVSLRAGADPNQVLPKVTAAVTLRLSRLNPGDTLVPSMISTAAENADTQNIASVVVVSPVVSIVPSVSQKIAAGSITYQ